MVEANEDALAVTLKIRRETRVAQEQAAAERTVGELALPPPVPAATPYSESLEAKVSVPVPESPSPPDAEAAFRRARLGVVAAIVLALLLVWIAQRRANLPRCS